MVEHSGQRLGDLIDFGGLKEAPISHGTVDVLGEEAGVSVFLDEQPVEPEPPTEARARRKF